MVNSDKSMDASYELASHYFLVRDFANAQRTIESTDIYSSWKSYLLHLALCDRAFIEADNEDWPFNGADRKSLRKLVLTGKLWSDLENNTDLETNPVPPVVLSTSFKLASRNRSQPEPIVSLIESQMLHNRLPHDVLIEFVTDVLIDLQHDFYYARELIKNQLQDEPVTQERVIKLIDQKEEEYIKMMDSEAQKLKQLEKQRMEMAIANANAANKKNSDEDDSIDDEVIDLKPATTDGAGDVVRGTGNKSQNKVTTRNTHRVTLTEYWRRWFRNFIRSQGLYNFLIFLSLLLAVVSNANIRASLNRGGRWTWQVIKAGFKMGVRVTYL